MSRHECIKMFDLVMRALLFIIDKVGGSNNKFYNSLGDDFENFMGELAFKDGDENGNFEG